MLSNNKGFSLIELMVVVAIIAILSTIAIPSYQTFQSKARQKEGFALLAAYYTAAQSSKQEYGFFPGEFPATGFSPSGQLGYTIRASNNATGTLPYGLTPFPGCINTANVAADAGCPVNYRVNGAQIEWNDQQLGAIGVTLGSFAPTAPPAATATTFQANAAGIVSTKAAARDEYSINQNKQLLMITDGLK